MHRVARSLPALAVALGALGCGASPRPPCDGRTSCGEGAACIVGACRPVDAEVVPASARREVLEPVAIAVLGSGGAEPPPVTSLGALASAPVELLLRFHRPLAKGETIHAAYLVLDRDPEGPPGSSPIELELSAVIEPWAPARLGPTRRPRVGAPLARLVAPTSSTAPLRIDVTDMLERSNAEEHGFAVRAATRSAEGVRVVTGAALGEPPRLELYLK